MCNDGGAINYVVVKKTPSKNTLWLEFFKKAIIISHGGWENIRVTTNVILGQSLACYFACIRSACVHGRVWRLSSIKKFLFFTHTCAEINRFPVRHTIRAATEL